MKHQQPPLMSIVVLNWNGLEDTKICLEHLRKLDYPNYEIILVDNGSRPDQKAYLANEAGVTFVDLPVNTGFTGGHIAGLEYCRGDFIVLLNNDAVMQADYLTLALEHFENPDVAVVGGRSYFWNDDNPLLDQTNAFYAYQNINVATGEAFMQSTDCNVPQIVNNVSGSAVIVRRSVIDDIGYLYDRFFAYFEETDLFARVKRAGYKVIYDPRLHIWHRNGASSGASSGSHFFFYQIFRNRFIFAMRNFETRSLWRFLYIYARLSLSSCLRWWLRPGANRVMHRAYALAGLYNLLRLPVLVASRWELHSQLGPSTYNHMIFGEQTGVSFVYDCTSYSAVQLTHLRRTLAADTNPLHEYILVVRGRHSADFTKDQPNVRHVVDTGYFTVSPLNLGCLAARFDWMAVGDAAHPLDPTAVHQAVANTLGATSRLIAFGDHNGYLPAIVLHKELFVFAGGLGAGTQTACLQSLIWYAQRHHVLEWSIAPVTSAKASPLPEPTAAEIHQLDSRIHIDKHIARDGRLSLYGRIKAKYYRIYQLTFLIRWLFLRKVSLYLKAARLKNLLLFTFTLRRKQLALELKHIRNEVIINTTPGDLPRQREVTAARLAHLSQHPTEIPVFIICRDRVDSMKVLVRWLEKHGLRRIIFIDNDSVYPPLVDFFDHTSHQVIKLYRNVGHTSPWSLGLVRALLPEDFYIVTDPDVIPTEECPDDGIKHFLAIHKQYDLYLKVGFSLRIDDLPDHYPLKKSVVEWESQFWKQQLAPEIYEAGVDTTFALYKPFSYTYKLHPSIRTGFPYVARHLPWYVDPKKISQEERHYRFRADHNVSSWNADELEDRYAHELKSQK
jgi:GT2 family glycosyltransferase